MSYAELITRSAFSLLEGASRPEDLVRRADEIGMPALGLTDIFDLGGAVRFTRACDRAGVRPLVGAELFRVPGRRLVLLCRNREGYRNLSHLITASRRAFPRGEPRLPEGGAGSGTRGERELHPTAAALEGRATGLVCLVRVCADDTEGYGDVGGASESAGSASGSAVETGAPGGSENGAPRGPGWTRAALRDLRALFPDRLHLALEHHGLPEDARRCARWLRISAEEGIPWVPTNVPRYARPEGRIVQDVLTCLRHDVTLREAGDRLLPNGEWYLKSAQQMRMRWCERGEIGVALESGAPRSGTGRISGGAPAARSASCSCRGCRGMRRTLRIAERCRFRITDLEPRLPAFPTPGGRDSEAFLRALAEEGARERYGETFGAEHRGQLDHELEVISKLGLTDYFLIVWDIVRFARRRGILVQGRGSAANSVVCYCLGVTAVDPVGMDLLFERFLSEERDEAPDIDLDFAHRDREEVLQYVYRTYGREHAAMVCETISYRGRMAVRDAARVLGLPTDTADRLSAEVERGEAEEAADRLARHGGEALRAADLDPKTARALLRIVRGLHRLPRHRSIHVGGFVLSARPLGEVVPIEAASMEDRTIIQWDKDDLEAVGLVKFDLLGLGMLTVLGDALRMVRRSRGVVLDLTDLPVDDPEVFDMICAADTVGVFQIESRAQMNTLPRMRPRCFYDLVIEVALIRPGPIQGQMVHPYLRRRRGEEPVTYLDPRLKPILERTLGVPLFQEQGMKVAVTLAGFTPGQADGLRRAMGFKRSKEAMEEVGRDLARGLKENGVSPEVARRVFRQLTGFANYGFPESHAASFALLVYASAFLKRHYAPEFYAAMLNAQPMGFYAPSTLVHDARRHGVEVRPVDLAVSRWDCTLEPDVEAPESSAESEAGSAAGSTEAADASENLPAPPALRLGLRLVRGLGERARRKLERARAEAPFTSVEDVVRRGGLEESDLRTLAEAGAFRSLWPGRREALWEVLRRLRGEAGPLAPRPPENPTPPRLSRDATDGTAPRDVRASPSSPSSGRAPRFPPMSRAERLSADYRSLGLSPEGHPMECLREDLTRGGVLSSAALRRRSSGEEVAVAGIAICRQQPATARGVMFITLEDETGFANFVVMPDLRERFRAELRRPLLLLEGEVENEAGVVNVLTRRVRPLDPAGKERPGSGTLPSRDFR